MPRHFVANSCFATWTMKCILMSVLLLGAGAAVLPSKQRPHHHSLGHYKRTAVEKAHEAAEPVAVDDEVQLLSGSSKKESPHRHQDRHHQSHHKHSQSEDSLEPIAVEEGVFSHQQGHKRRIHHHEDQRLPMARVHRAYASRLESRTSRDSMDQVLARKGPSPPPPAPPGPPALTCPGSAFTLGCNGLLSGVQSATQLAQQLPRSPGAIVGSLAVSVYSTAVQGLMSLTVGAALQFAGWLTGVAGAVIQDAGVVVEDVGNTVSTALDNIPFVGWGLGWLVGTVFNGAGQIISDVGTVVTGASATIQKATSLLLRAADCAAGATQGLNCSLASIMASAQALALQTWNAAAGAAESIAGLVTGVYWKAIDLIHDTVDLIQAIGALVTCGSSTQACRQALCNVVKDGYSTIVGAISLGGTAIVVASAVYTDGATADMAASLEAMPGRELLGIAGSPEEGAAFTMGNDLMAAFANIVMSNALGFTCDMIAGINVSSAAAANNGLSF